jgi:iron complex outermembrane receptor protein
LGQSSQIGYNAQDPNRITDNSGTVLTPAQKNTIDTLLATAGISILPGDAFYASYFTNVGDTRTRGVELTLEANQETNWGKLRWSYAANVGRTTIQKVRDIPVVLQGLPNINLLTKSSEYALRFRTPSYTQVAGLGWQQGRWRSNLDFTYFGPIKRLNNGVEYRQPPVLVTSLSGGVELGAGWSATLGINNLFDERTRKVPEYARSATDVASIETTWDTGDVLSTIGAFWYGRVHYRF